MQTQTIEINLPAELVQQLDERAKQTGRNRADYAGELLAKNLRAPTLNDLLAPLRQQFEESGMTDDELDALVEEVRDEIWRRGLQG